MGSIFKPPTIQMPSPPPEPKILEAPPAVDDTDRIKKEEEEMRARDRKRKGRRSTILTGPQGLNEIEEENIKKRTLLGD